jgi:hypothetical protein
MEAHNILTLPQPQHLDLVQQTSPLNVGGGPLQTNEAMCLISGVLRAVAAIPLPDLTLVESPAPLLTYTQMAQEAAVQKLLAQQ